MAVLFKYLFVPLLLLKVCCFAVRVLKRKSEKGGRREKNQGKSVYSSGGALIKKSDSVQGFFVCVLLNNCPGLGL